MRSILFNIPLRANVELGPLGEVPLFGVGLLLICWIMIGVPALIIKVRQNQWKEFLATGGLTWGIVAVALIAAPRFAKSIPVYGYGTMLFIGFLVSTWVVSARIRNQGFNGEIAWDAAMWLFIAGIFGARLFYVIQYSDKFFVKGRSIGQVLLSLISLPDGGIVFYGGLIGGAVAYYLYCRVKGIHPLAFADIVITSVFIGMAFGRIGCLLHGCCYGDYCSLPWAVTFPPESVPTRELVLRGFLMDDSVRSLPLHPTQIYSAMGSGLLAVLTWAYYPFRQKDGSVLLLGWMTYPVHRFLVEFLRGDELGQFGTSLTISQWVSLGLLICGAIFALWLKSQSAVRHPLIDDAPVEVPSETALA